MVASLKTRPFSACVWDYLLWDCVFLVADVGGSRSMVEGGKVDEEKKGKGKSQSYPFPTHFARVVMDSHRGKDA